MSSTESSFSVNQRLKTGEQVTLRGDTWGDFVSNAQSALGEDDGMEFAIGIFKAAFGSFDAAPTMEQAVQTVQQTFPGAVPVVPQPAIPNVGRPAAGPGEAPPGMKWVPAGISKKTQKPYAGFWASI